MRISERDRKAIVMGAVVLALLLGYAFVLRPVVDSWSRARQRIAVASAAQASLESQAVKLRSQRRQLESVYGPALSRPLPRVDEARANFVKSVEDLLKASGMASQGVRSQPLRPLREVAGAVLVGLQVECTGQPRQLMACLARMSAADDLMLVESIRAAADARQRDRLQVSMVVSTIATTEAAQ